MKIGKNQSVKRQGNKAVRNVLSLVWNLSAPEAKSSFLQVYKMAPEYVTPIYRMFSSRVNKMLLLFCLTLT